MKNYRFLLIAITFVLAVPVLLYGPGCPGKGGRPESLSIGAVLKCSSNPFFSEMEKGIRETADENHIKVAVVAPGHRDAEEQVRLLGNMIDLNVSCLIFTPEGKTASIPMIVNANRKNIPVILLDTGLDEEKARAAGARYECLITSANQHGGELAGEFIADKMKGHGQVLLVPGDAESYSGEKRINGFRSIIQKYPRITVLTAPPSDFSRALAFEKSREIFKSHRTIKAVFALNDQMAIGVYDAMRVSGLKNICIVGFDATEAGMKAVVEGQISATVTQHPYSIGKLGVESFLKLRKGEKLPPVIFTQTELLTTEKLRMPFESK